MQSYNWIDDNFSKDWKFLKLEQKEELVYSWYVDCGAISGRRYSKQELSSLLAFKPGELEFILEEIRKKLSSIFIDRESLQANISELLSKSLHYMHSDRSRTIAHANILETELEKLLIAHREAEALPERTSEEKLYKLRKVNSIMTSIKSFSYQKIESIRLLFEGMDRVNNFFSLFTGNKRLSLDFVVPAGNKNKDEEILDHKTAIKLLEEQMEPILPKQEYKNTGVKNPHIGFEEFKTEEVA